MATFHANGGLNTRPGSIFQKQGLNLKLEPGDDFHQQVRDYMEGKSPFLRGTYRMIGMASEVIGSDPRTKGVVFMQMTWSAGDHMVGRDSIKNSRDLKGKTIVLQSGGPHVGMLDDVLRTANVDWDDINVIWAADLTATPNSPAELFRKNKNIDACFVITPDMIGLTGGNAQDGSWLTGSGREGTVRGAKVKASTLEMSRSIADVYVCRKDFFDANRNLVQKFAVGYLKAAEQVAKMRNDFEGSKDKRLDKHIEYKNLLTMSQSIYTTDVMPTLEEDAHGLLLDCSFVGYPGNWKFFTWGPGNIVGFESLNKKALELGVKRGYVRRREELLSPGSLYDSSLFASNLRDSSRPKPTVGTTTGIFGDGSEIRESDFGEETVEFTINFLPDQIDFSARQYGSDFDAVLKASATYASCAVVIIGHADPTKALKTLVAAGTEKGILKKSGGMYYVRGKRVDIETTSSVVSLIETGAFESASSGSPLEIVRAAKTLSTKRAENVRKSLIAYAHDRGIILDPSQFVVKGVGIAEPIIAAPRSYEQARVNMRVEFSLRPIKAESGGDALFDY